MTDRKFHDGYYLKTMVKLKLILIHCFLFKSDQVLGCSVFISFCNINRVGPLSKQGRFSVQGPGVPLLGRSGQIFVVLHTCSAYQGGVCVIDVEVICTRRYPSVGTLTHGAFETAQVEVKSVLPG